MSQVMRACYCSDTVSVFVLRDINAYVEHFAKFIYNKLGMCK